MAQANLLCYETLVAFRDSHPVRFDHNHAFYGSLLTKTALMDLMVARWEAHEQRLKSWNPYLWRPLDGYVYYLDKRLARNSGLPSHHYSDQTLAPQGGPIPTAVAAAAAAPTVAEAVAAVWGSERARADLCSLVAGSTLLRTDSRRHPSSLDAANPLESHMSCPGPHSHALRGNLRMKPIELARKPKTWY